MPLCISDEALRAANLTEQEARVEIACFLYQSHRLDLWPAAQLAAMTRDEFWSELLRRGIPVFTITEEDLRRDTETLDRVLGPVDRK